MLTLICRLQTFLPGAIKSHRSGTHTNALSMLKEKCLGVFYYDICGMRDNI